MLLRHQCVFRFIMSHTKDMFKIFKSKKKKPKVDNSEDQGESQNEGREESEG